MQLAQAFTTGLRSSHQLLQCGVVLTALPEKHVDQKVLLTVCWGKEFPLFSEEVQLSCWLTLILGGQLRLQETSN